MSISIVDFTSLKTAVAEWALRSDAKTTSRIPDFIALAEKQMHIRKLRVREMLVNVVGYIDSDNLTINYPTAGLVEVWQAEPTGTWTGTIGAPVVTAGKYPPLEKVSTILQRSQWATPGRPEFFADNPLMSGWEFWPVGAYEITLAVWGDIVPLSDAAPTNAILTTYPHLYLYGALAELERFLKIPPAESQGWSADFAAAIEVANRATNQLAYSGSTLRARSPR